MKKKYVVLTSEYGSGARLAGKILAEKLGVEFYGEKRLMKLASEQYGIDENLLIDFETKILDSNANNISNIEKVNVNGRDYSISTIYEDIILSIVNKGPCVLMERGADIILSGRDDVLNVYAYSSNVDKKIERCIKIGGILKKHAAEYVRFQDAQRKKYYSLVYNFDRALMSQYDLCIDTDSLGIEKCAEVIRTAL